MMQARSNILPKLKACQIKIKFDIINLKIIKDIEHMTIHFTKKKETHKIGETNKKLLHIRNSTNRCKQGQHQNQGNRKL